ncbi:MAG: hypothetical protein HFF39_10475 [Lawsonibacter sp.]|nr:hypothetical protein [Lawsonibacter sp.]
MEAAQHKFGSEWGRFDRCFKLVPYHEAIGCLRELQRKSGHEKPLDARFPGEWGKGIFIPPSFDLVKLWNQIHIPASNCGS